LKKQVKQLQRRVVDKNTPLQCCCEELKAIYEDRQAAIEQISEHWKEKTHQLVSNYYQSLKVVREDQQRVRESTFEHLEKLREFQQSMVADIVGKTEDMAAYYDKKLRIANNENRKLTKRLIKARNKKKKL